jgi:hypothetical protein
MSNPLRDLVPGDVRRIGYTVLSTIGVGLTGLNAGFTAVGGTIPTWLVFTSAFYVTVSGAGFAVSASNVNQT